MADVFKILEDLKWKAVGVDPTTGQVPENQFVSFLPIGLPIPEEDFKNPWSPTQSNLKESMDEAKKSRQASESGTDPAQTEAASASAMIEETMMKSALIGRDMMSYLQTFSLTDTKISIDETYRGWPTASKVNDTWYAIINGANAVPSGLELSDELQKAVKKAERVLIDEEGEETKKYERYAQYREEYYDAVRERDRQYANAISDPLKMNMWPIQGKVYQDDVDYAWDKWQSRGYKQEIEEAEAFLSSQGIDPAILMIRRAKTKYETSLINMPSIGNIPYTFITPSKWYSKNGPGWNTYTSSDYNSKTNYSTQKTSTKVSSDVKSGFFLLGKLDAGMNYSKDTSKKEIHTSMEGLTITFSYCVANINRPWMDTSLLNIGNWFLVGDYPKQCISSGSIDQEFSIDNPNEFVLLPSVVTSLILIKDVKIRWKSGSFDSTELKSAVEGGGNVSFGNIFASGHASASHRREDYNYNSDLNLNSQGLDIDGVQLIGYVSSIMPLSPKLNGKDYTQKKKDAPVKEEDKK
ncbi:hypothetical protein [Sphingobacterium hungaricum]|uniref:Uncharacterized protein n=1 Tax=Sphingobacterium hungaricum TaxID=2082723 RepID=A0A928V0U0_9SPHI|nr:hypothetical protein [Sphingobacterium hungaricum]MBE8714891.1 hypothetical protein [Sphingobacterium hungaricum]